MIAIVETGGKQYLVREGSSIDVEKLGMKAGDAVSVHVRIKEGDKERIQEFKGTVIRMRKSGNDANFTVRRTASHGIGVERTFLLRSPRIEKVEVQRHASVRRAQLYYLRDLTGKKARLREKREA